MWGKVRRSCDGVRRSAQTRPELNLSPPPIAGIDAVRQWWREWCAAWETLQFEYELVDAGERVVALLDLGMRGRSSGIEVPSAKVAWVSTLRDGLMVHLKDKR